MQKLRTDTKQNDRVMRARSKRESVIWKSSEVVKISSEQNYQCSFSSNVHTSFGFTNKVISRRPVELKKMAVSRKLMLDFEISAVKHWLQNVKKSSKACGPCLHTIKISSMYLFQMIGVRLLGALVRMCSLQCFIYMFAKLGTKGDPIAVPWICMQEVPLSSKKFLLSIKLNICFKLCMGRGNFSR